MKKKLAVSRREFVGAAAAAASLMIVPRHVVAQSGKTPPSEKLRIAAVGVAGQGRADLNNLAGEDIIALCDVDLQHAADSFKQWPKAQQFRDFRKMFDQLEKQIDAVLVATPDHCHAVVAMAAIKRGKHVYCEKPLAHSVYEIRQLMTAAKEHNVVTHQAGVRRREHEVPQLPGGRHAHQPALPRGLDAVTGGDVRPQVRYVPLNAW